MALRVVYKGTCVIASTKVKAVSVHSRIRLGLRNSPTCLRWSTVLACGGLSWRSGGGREDGGGSAGRAQRWRQRGCWGDLSSAVFPGACVAFSHLGGRFPSACQEDQWSNTSVLNVFMCSRYYSVLLEDEHRTAPRERTLCLVLELALFP